MLTEAIITAVLEQTGRKALNAVTRSGIGYVRDSLAARLDSDHQFQRAQEDERDAILWTLHAVLRATVRSVFGRDLGEDQVAALLFKVASDPDTRRRFRALLNAAVQSSDERIAMLAVGYFVDARSTSLRARIDVALPTLFPDDAAALGHALDLLAVTPGRRFVAAVAYPESEAHIDHWQLCALRNERVESGPVWVSAHSLRGLDRAQCIAMTDGVIVADNLALPDGPGGPERHHALEVLPMGFELHRILGTVDWRSIHVAARSR